MCWEFFTAHRHTILNKMNIIVGIINEEKRRGVYFDSSSSELQTEY